MLKKIWDNIKTFLYYTFITVFIGQFLYYIFDYLLFNSSVVQNFQSNSYIPSWGLFILGMFFVGVKEECVFRYLILDEFFRRLLKLPTYIAILISSLLFGIAHFINYPSEFWYHGIPQVIMASFLGIIFAYTYLKKGLWFPIFLHAIYNILVGVIWYVKLGILLIGLIICLSECIYYAEKGFNKLIQKKK